MSHGKNGRVLIIGGGIGGLALAIGLLKRGFEVSVYDKAREFREIGTGVVMSPNGTKAAFRLDRDTALALTSHFGNAGAPDTPHPILTPDGKARGDVRGFRTRGGYLNHAFALRRATIHRTLLDAVPKECLHTGKKLVRFEEGPNEVRAFFEDGTQESGDLLVGCDGWRSTVRVQMNPSAQLRHLGVTSVRGIVTLKNFRYPNGFMVPDRRNELVFFCVPIHDSPGDYYISVLFAAPHGVWPAKPRHTVKAELLERVGTRNQLARELIEASADEHQYVADLVDMLPLQSWSTPRVTILGDAAHPVSPFIGMGVNTAFEDSAVLSELLAKHHTEPARALKRYETTRIPRMIDVMQVGWKHTHMSIFASPMERSANPVVRAFGRALGVKLTPVTIFHAWRFAKALYIYELPEHEEDTSKPAAVA